MRRSELLIFFATTSLTLLIAYVGGAPSLSDYLPLGVSRPLNVFHVQVNELASSSLRVNRGLVDQIQHGAQNSLDKVIRLPR